MYFMLLSFSDMCWSIYHVSVVCYVYPGVMPYLWVWAVVGDSP